MRTVLCLLAALASADAAAINCKNWSGICSSDKTKSDDTCETTPPPGRSSDVLTVEVQPCSTNVCCRSHRCSDVVTCPSSYTRKDATSCYHNTGAETGRDSTVLAPAKVQGCSQSLCCESTCGAAVTCPANKDSETHKARECVPPSNNDAGSRGADVLTTRCEESSCCLDTCASGFTCDSNLNSADQAKVVCNKPVTGSQSQSHAESRFAESLEYRTCSPGLCCRASCKSQGHVCPDGQVFGKHELRSCTRPTPPPQLSGAKEASASVLGVSPEQEETTFCFDTTCCEVVHKCAADFDCKANAKHKTDMASVTCVGRACEVADCCVDAPVTCAEAESRCTGNSTLKTTASAIACGLSDLVADGAGCTLEKCCNYKKDVACADNTACRAGGDSGATCLNGVCQCTATYLPTATNAENVLVQGCELNRIWFSLTFTDGDFGLLTEAHQAAIANALAKLLKKLLRIQFSRGSIVVSGEAETLYDSVAQAAISAAVQGAAPQSVLGSKIETSLSKEDLTCTSTDAGALSAVKATFNGKVECVPTLCNVAKGYSAQPVSHRCVLRTVLDGGDDDLSTGAKVGIALGVIAFVAIVVGVVVLVVLKGGKSEAAPAENEPAADEKEMSNQV